MPKTCVVRHKIDHFLHRIEEHAWKWPFFIKQHVSHSRYARSKTKTPYLSPYMGRDFDTKKTRNLYKICVKKEFIAKLYFVKDIALQHKAGCCKKCMHETSRNENNFERFALRKFNHVQLLSMKRLISSDLNEGEKDT